MSKVQVIDDRLLDQTIDCAYAEPRQRTLHSFHSGPEDNPHRFLNALVRGTYVAPHLHEQKSETFIVLRGLVGVLIFNPEGKLQERHLLGEHVHGIDIPQGIYHTVVCVTPEAILFEVKPGPYVQATDKRFPSWAPLEGSEGVVAYKYTLGAMMRGAVQA